LIYIAYLVLKGLKEGKLVVKIINGRER